MTPRKCCRFGAPKASSIDSIAAMLIDIVTNALRIDGVHPRDAQIGS